MTPVHSGGSRDCVVGRGGGGEGGGGSLRFDSEVLFSYSSIVLFIEVRFIITIPIHSLPFGSTTPKSGVVDTKGPM